MAGDRFIPMQASIKSILNGVVVIALVLAAKCFWTVSFPFGYPHRKRMTSWKETAEEHSIRVNCFRGPVP